MHPSLGKTALIVSFLLVSAPLATAQSPLYTPGMLGQAPVSPQAGPGGAVPIGAIEQLSQNGHPVTQVQHSTNCNFDPYQSYHEARFHQPKMSWREKHITSGSCDDCYGHGTHGHGLGAGLGGLLGCGFGEECPDFECANCWAWLDVEKRFHFAWSYGNAHKPATQIGYGDMHGALFTTEVLPWVLVDGDQQYTRWGISTMFGYYSSEGNRGGRLESEATGRQISVDRIEMLNLTIGPTIRTDFYVGPIRLSPNAFGGIAFDWTDVSEIRPIPGTPVRQLETFKYGGFDVGGYVRLMLDFGITKKLNIGVGMDYKATPTEIMIRKNETRKHLGFVLALSHEF